jgi:hypothetical protein
MEIMYNCKNVGCKDERCHFCFPMNFHHCSSLDTDFKFKLTPSYKDETLYKASIKAYAEDMEPGFFEYEDEESYYSCYDVGVFNLEKYKTILTVANNSNIIDLNKYYLGDEVLWKLEDISYYDDRSVSGNSYYENNPDLFNDEIIIFAFADKIQFCSLKLDMRCLANLAYYIMNTQTAIDTVLYTKKK